MAFPSCFVCSSNVSEIETSVQFPDALGFLQEVQAVTGHKQEPEQNSRGV